VCRAVKTASPAARTTTPIDGARPQASGQKGVAAVALTPTTVRAHRTTVRSSIFFLLRAAAAPAVVISVFMTSSPVVLTSELYQRGRVYVKRLLHRDKQIFRSFEFSLANQGSSRASRPARGGPRRSDRRPCGPNASGLRRAPRPRS